MPYRRSSEPIRRTADALTRDLVGIGFVLAARGSKSPNLEDTLLAASIAGMVEDDLRVLSILTTWFGVHSSRVNADRLIDLVARESSLRVRAF